MIFGMSSHCLEYGCKYDYHTKICKVCGTKKKKQSKPEEVQG